MRTLDPDRFEPACGHVLVTQDVRDCEEIMFNAETAEPAEKFLLLLKATTKARRHEESQGAFRVFVSSWLHFSVSSAFTPRIFAGSSPDGDGSNRRTRAALDFQRLND